MTKNPLPEIGSKGIIGKTALACLNQDVFPRLYKYASQKDDDAYRSEVMKGLVSGDCIALQEGEAVFISDVSVWSGNTKIRPVGKTEEYWTFTSAVVAGVP